MVALFCRFVLVLFLVRVDWLLVAVVTLVDVVDVDVDGTGPKQKKKKSPAVLFCLP